MWEGTEGPRERGLFRVLDARGNTVPLSWVGWPVEGMLGGMPTISLTGNSNGSMESAPVVTVRMQCPGALFFS